MAITDAMLDRALIRGLFRELDRILDDLQANLEMDYDARGKGDLSPNHAARLAHNYERDANCLLAFERNNEMNGRDRIRIQRMANDLLRWSRDMRSWVDKVMAIRTIN